MTRTNKRPKRLYEVTAVRSTTYATLARTEDEAIDNMMTGDAPETGGETLSIDATLDRLPGSAAAASAAAERFAAVADGYREAVRNGVTVGGLFTLEVSPAARVDVRGGDEDGDAGGAWVDCRVWVPATEAAR